MDAVEIPHQELMPRSDPSCYAPKEGRGGNENVLPASQVPGPTDASSRQVLRSPNILPTSGLAQKRPTATEQAGPSKRPPAHQSDESVARAGTAEVQNPLDKYENSTGCFRKVHQELLDAAAPADPKLSNMLLCLKAFDVEGPAEGAFGVLLKQLTPRGYETTCKYAACLLRSAKSFGLAPVGLDGEALAKELEVKAQLGKPGSCDMLEERIVMEALQAMAQEDMANRSGLVNGVGGCQPVSWLGSCSSQPHPNQSPGFVAASSFASCLKRDMVNDTSAGMVLDKLWSVLSVVGHIYARTGWALQQLLSFTLGLEGELREVAALKFTQVLEIHDRQPGRTAILKQHLFHLLQTSSLHLRQGFLNATGTHVLDLGLRLRRFLGEWVWLSDDPHLALLSPPVMCSTEAAQGKEAAFLYASVLWECRGPMSLAAAKLLLYRVQRMGKLKGEGLVVEGFEGLTTFQEMTELVTALVRLRRGAMEAGQPLWRQEDEPALLKALLLRWLALASGGTKFSPAPLVGAVLLFNRATLSQVALRDVASSNKVQQLLTYTVAFLNKCSQEGLSAQDLRYWAAAIFQETSLDDTSLSVLIASYTLYVQHVEPFSGNGIKVTMILALSKLQYTLRQGPIATWGAIYTLLQSVRAILVDIGFRPPRESREALVLGPLDLNRTLPLIIQGVKLRGKGAGEKQVVEVANDILVRANLILRESTVC